MGALTYFLYDPITEMLDQREKKIKNDLDHAKARKHEAEKLKEKYEAELKKARGKAQDIVDEAERRGKKKAKEIIDNARDEAELLKENKLKEIDQAKRDALDQIRNEVASISIMAANKLLREELDRNKHEKLINQYINNLDEEKLGEA